jgi:hypothetical protein
METLGSNWDARELATSAPARVQTIGPAALPTAGANAENNVGTHPIDWTTEGTRNPMGAPKRNRNAMRHGLRCSRLPPSCEHIRRTLGTLRRALEQSVLDRLGRLGVAQAGPISSACRHERRCSLLERRLRLEGVDGIPTERLILVLREISNATDSRDRCIKALGLDPEPEPTTEAGSRQDFLRLLRMLPPEVLQALRPPASDRPIPATLAQLPADLLASMNARSAASRGVFSEGEPATALTHAGSNGSPAVESDDANKSVSSVEKDP